MKLTAVRGRFFHKARRFFLASVVNGFLHLRYHGDESIPPASVGGAGAASMNIGAINSAGSGIFRTTPRKSPTPAASGRYADSVQTV